MSWEENLVVDPHGIAEILRNSRVIAVLGMEREKNAVRPAYAVPKFLRQRGYEVVPLPVKYPDVTEVDGLRAYHSLSDVPQDIDIVDVFRLPRDIPKHLDDILAKKPKAVWFQSGIRHDAAAETLARAGIKVVQDRCMRVEVMRLGRGSRPLV
jgi:predicted CoA-binding protein